MVQQMVYFGNCASAVEENVYSAVCWEWCSLCVNSVKPVNHDSQIFHIPADIFAFLSH